MTDRSTQGRCVLVASCLLIASAAGLSGCNEHPVELANSGGIFDYYPPPPPTEAAKVDILWVIDNSGSMCQEQAKLRSHFGSFIEEFGEKNIDFNIGVTTTQMEPIYGPEPVAVPGRLQSTPQPLPSSFEGCVGDEGDPSEPRDGFDSIRTSIEAAVGCTEDESQWAHLEQVEDSVIACAVDPACPETALADLFPTEQNGQSPYRTIPKVLSASDPAYQHQDGRVDLAKLERDFACMSFVGTRGHPIEKGLAAAIKAVSPEMTGGTVENPIDESAPNHGLLREGAQFATIFLTDENDCTHDGSLDECHSNVCEFANHPELEDSPLISPEELSSELVASVAASKGVDPEEFNPRDIVVASLHGNSLRYGGSPEYPQQMPPSPNTCGEDVLPAYKVEASCNTAEFGSAFSGDRYARFMRTFDDDRIYPRPNDAGEIAGLICTPDDFATYMSGVAATIVGSVEACITHKPRGCEGADASTCGDFAFGGEQGQCVAFGKSSRSFCDSAVQVRLFADERGLEALRGHDFCIPESLDSPMTPGGCVVSPDVYKFVECNGNDDGFIVELTPDRWFEKVRGFDLEVVVSSGDGTRP